jgi:hypothetical protein
VIKTINQQTRSGREQPVRPHIPPRNALILPNSASLPEHVRTRAVLYAFGAASIARPWWIIDVEDRKVRSNRRLEKLKGRRDLLMCGRPHSIGRAEIRGLHSRIARPRQEYLRVGTTQ